MTRFVGAEFQVNQICGEEQETRKITAEYISEQCRLITDIVTSRMKKQQDIFSIRQRRIPLFLYTAISFIRKIADLKHQENFSKGAT